MTLLVPALLYHAVEGESPLLKDMERPPSSRYVLEKKEFYAQMCYLFKNCFRTTTIEDMAGWGEDKVIQKSVILTFDDGYMSDIKHVAPILKEFSFTAYFFICPGLVGQRGHMGWGEVKRLANEFMIGSHGINHLPLTRLSDADLVSEIEGSRKKLEDHLGRMIDTFSVPHGAYDQRIRKLVRAAGYKKIFTSDPFPNSNWSDPYYLGRFSILRNISHRKFAGLIRMERLLLVRERMAFRLKEYIKQKRNSWAK